MEESIQVVFGDEVREKLLEGLNVLYRSVKHTFGSHNRNTIIETYGRPKLTCNGFETISDIELRDKVLNTSVGMVKDGIKKMKDKVGDGTTMALLLTYQIVEETVRYIAAGHDPMQVKRSIEDAADKIISKLKEMAQPISNDDEIMNVAVASASGDVEVGKNVALAISKVGKDGIITIGKSESGATELKFERGTKINQGFLSPYFATNSTGTTAQLKDAKILITDKKINTIQDILPILQECAVSKHPLLIISKMMEEEVLSSIVLNKVKGMLDVCAIQAPSFGGTVNDLLQDVAVLTGGLLVSEEAGGHLSEIGMNSLGSAREILIDKESTTFIDGAGSKDEIDNRVNHLNSVHEYAKSELEKANIRQRAACLSGAVCQILVGAFSEIEVKEIRKKYEDSVGATREALESGVLPGGGASLVFASDCGVFSAGDKSTVGFDIMRRACRLPLQVICENAGLDSPHVLEEVMKSGFPFGVNINNQKIENLIESGIVDPLSVIECAINTAVSTAGIMALSEAIVVS